MPKTIDGAMTENMLRFEFPGVTDDDLRVIARLIETYQELPPCLRVKMRRFMLLMANDNKRTTGLARLAANGQITFRQLLEVL